MGRLFKGREKYTFQSLDSTNNFAAKLLDASNPAEGTVIMAQHQTAGRGQRSKNWEDEPGKNLLISAILRPEFLPVGQHALLNKSVALAVHDLVRSFCDTPDVLIKWPNDILIDHLKVAGILIENTVRLGHIDTSIVGVGINVLQLDFGDLPATSLSLASNRIIPVELAVEQFLDALEKRYNQLKAKQFNFIDLDYLSKLYGLNEKRTFLYGDEKIDAVIKGVNPDGKLILELSNGESITCSNGEIHYVN